MKCKNCGATLDEGALYCRKCGTAVPQKPESKPKRAAGGKRAKTGWLNRVSALIDGIRAWCVDAFAAVKGWFQNLGRSAFFRNRRLLMLTGIGAALLIVLIIVIASAASCKKTKTYKSPDEVTAALGAETARAFLEALGADRAQPLLYNNSGEARPEGPANARELREALAARAA